MGTVVIVSRDKPGKMMHHGHGYFHHESTSSEPNLDRALQEQIYAAAATLESLRCCFKPGLSGYCESGGSQSKAKYTFSQTL